MKFLHPLVLITPHGSSRILLLLCRLLLHLLNIPLILPHQLPTNYVLIYVKSRIQDIHIWMEEGRLPQPLLETINMLLDDAILQIVKLPNSPIILILQILIVFFQLPYTLV